MSDPINALIEIRELAYRGMNGINYEKIAEGAEYPNDDPPCYDDDPNEVCERIHMVAHAAIVQIQAIAEQHAGMPRTWKYVE